MEPCFTNLEKQNKRYMRSKSPHAKLHLGLKTSILNQKRIAHRKIKQDFQI